MNTAPDDKNRDLAGADFWRRTRGQRDAPRTRASLAHRLRASVLSCSFGLGQGALALDALLRNQNDAAREAKLTGW